MRAAVVTLFALLLVVACSHVQRVQQSEAAATASALPTAAPSPSPTPAYVDMRGVAAAPYIDQLTQLQVFWPPGGLFEPAKPVLRREFVRWLMRADAAIWAAHPSGVLHPAQPGAKQYFKDVATDDPDFAAIEGMHDAGISIGYPNRTFRPNVAITREEALAIKAYVDCGAPDPVIAGDLAQAYYELPRWKDAHRISHAYVAAIASCLLQDQGTTQENRLDTIARTFGSIAALQPQRPLDRAEAAAMLWEIGQQKPDLTNFPPRTAAEALAP